MQPKQYTMMVTSCKIQKTKQKQNKKKNAQPCRLLFGAFQSMKEQYKKIPPSPSTK